MRLVLAVMALFVLSAAAPVDRTRVVAATPEGGFRMGNAAAPVKLVEYGSLTCPHCRAFHEEALASLKRDYVAKGLVSYEYRNLVLNGPDFAVSMIARCDGPAAFFTRADALYHEQSVWLDPFMNISEEDAKRVGALPPEQQLVQMALAGKLDAYAMKLGMKRAHFDQCLGNKPQAIALEQLGKLATTQGVSGTPTFFLNGKRLETNTWPTIEPLLRSALKLKPKA